MGELPLRRLGLRFAWTDWHGHKSHYRLLDVARALAAWPKKFTWTLRRGRTVSSTADECVVPFSAPTDTVKYSPALGRKPAVTFNPPLVGQWDVILKRNPKGDCR